MICLPEISNKRMKGNKYLGNKLLHSQTKSGIASKMYGVSIKTVRDILDWAEQRPPNFGLGGATPAHLDWYRATYHLDASKPPAIERACQETWKAKRNQGQQAMDAGAEEICVHHLSTALHPFPIARNERSLCNRSHSLSEF